VCEWTHSQTVHTVMYGGVLKPGQIDIPIQSLHGLHAQTDNFAEQQSVFGRACRYAVLEPPSNQHRALGRTSQAPYPPFSVRQRHGVKFQCDTVPTLISDYRAHGPLYCQTGDILLNGDPSAMDEPHYPSFANTVQVRTKSGNKTKMFSLFIITTHTHRPHLERSHTLISTMPNSTSMVKCSVTRAVIAITSAIWRKRSCFEWISSRANVFALSTFAPINICL
jgi:hypothetical protein